MNEIDPEVNYFNVFFGPENGTDIIDNNEDKKEEE